MTRPVGDPPDIRTAVGETALAGGELLLSLDPVLGEDRLQRTVDAFVEQAADALRALARLAMTAPDLDVDLDVARGVARPVDLARPGAGAVGGGDGAGVTGGAGGERRAGGGVHASGADGADGRHTGWPGRDLRW